MMFKDLPVGATFHVVNHTTQVVGSTLFHRKDFQPPNRGMNAFYEREGQVDALVTIHPDDYVVLVGVPVLSLNDYCGEMLAMRSLLDKAGAAILKTNRAPKEILDQITVLATRLRATHIEEPPTK